MLVQINNQFPCQILWLFLSVEILPGT
jgi:hypothetical protein